MYRCSVCGQIIGIVKKTGSPVVCCGKPMQELIPCSTDGEYEKHVPVMKIAGQNVHVTVGAAPHPMQQEHNIEWIMLMTRRGSQLRELEPGMKPEACFCVCPDDEALAAYALCNLHGLWNTVGTPDSAWYDTCRR